MRNALRLLLLALLAAPMTVDAQRNARLGELKAQYDSTLKRLKRYDDSVRGANAKLDSLQIGQLRISAEPSLRGLATRAAEIALDTLRPHLGATLERSRRYHYVLRVERFNQWRTNKPDSNVIIEAYDRVGPPIMNIRQRYDTALVASSIRIYEPYLIVRQTSLSFIGWMGGFVSLDSLTRDDWKAIRFGLVSSPAAVARRCYAGDLAACSITLQFTPVSDTVLQWYDANDRQRIVKRTENTALRIDGIGAKRCIEGDDASCVVLLRKYPPGVLPAPAALQARTALTRLAIQLGGAGAIERMLEGDRQPLERLSAAARMPVDSLISRWQTSARTMRASSRDLSAEIVLGALFWSVALGALSLRSSRWR
jgi:hypothetical protein